MRCCNLQRLHSEDFPSWIEIDWEKTAANVQQDYSSLDWDGVTYYYRDY